MVKGISGRALGKQLILRGLCPANATDVTLLITVDGAVKVRYDVLVEVDDLPKIADALSALHAANVEPKP